MPEDTTLEMPEAIADLFAPKDDAATEPPTETQQATDETESTRTEPETKSTKSETQTHPDYETLKRQYDELKGAVEPLQQMRAEIEAARQQKLYEEQLQQQESQFEEDPLGVLRNEIEQLKQYRQQVEQYSSFQQQQQEQVRQMANIAAAQTQAFRSKTPDYDNAYKHLQETRMQELTGIWGADQATAMETIQNEMAGIVEYAVTHGMNPAQLVYNLAQQRGYAAQQNAPAGAGKQDKDLRRAMGVSLSELPGTADSSEKGAGDPWKMTDAEFEEEWKKIERAAMGM